MTIYIYIYIHHPISHQQLFGFHQLSFLTRPSLCSRFNVVFSPWVRPGANHPIQGLIYTLNSHGHAAYLNEVNKNRSNIHQWGHQTGNVASQTLSIKSEEILQQTSPKAASQETETVFLQHVQQLLEHPLFFHNSPLGTLPPQIIPAAPVGRSRKWGTSPPN